MNIRLFNKISEEVWSGSRYDDVVEKYGVRVIEKYMEFGVFIRYLAFSKIVSNVKFFLG